MTPELFAVALTEATRHTATSFERVDPHAVEADGGARRRRAEARAGLRRVAAVLARFDTEVRDAPCRRVEDPC